MNHKFSGINVLQASQKGAQALLQTIKEEANYEAEEAHDGM